jgi:hypothetical protein
MSSIKEVTPGNGAAAAANRATAVGSGQEMAYFFMCRDLHGDLHGMRALAFPRALANDLRDKRSEMARVSSEICPKEVQMSCSEKKRSNPAEFDSQPCAWAKKAKIASQVYTEAFAEARRSGKYVFVPAPKRDVNLGIVVLCIEDMSKYRPGDILDALPPGSETIPL